MTTPKKLFAPVRPNLKHKTDVLNHDKVSQSPCDLKFRPPSFAWNSDDPLNWRFLCQAASVGLMLGLMFRNQNSLIVLLSFVTVALFYVVPLCAVATIGVLTFSTWYRRHAWTREEVYGLIRCVLIYPLLHWLVAVATYFTLWPIGAAMFLLTLGTWATFRLAEQFATHALAWMLANPRIDRATADKWEADWQCRRDGLSSPAPRSPDLTEQQRSDFAELLHARSTYRHSRKWMWLCWAGPILLAFVALDAATAIRPLLMGFGIVAALFFWASVQRRRFPNSVSVFRMAFRSWLDFRREIVNPPWMFDTPAGPQITRWMATYGAVILISIGIVPLANYFPLHVLFRSPSEWPMLSNAVVPDGWWFQALQGARLGIWRDCNAVVQSTLAILVIPALVFVLTIYSVTAPMLSVWHRLLEAPDAIEHLPGETDFDGYVRRLQESRNPLERNSLLLGFNTKHEYPVLLDADLLFEHLHMVGATGIGKTALGLITQVTQLIRRNDGPVIVVDCKGDPAFFQTVHREAKLAGRKFKWFTNQPNHSTYVFNPFKQSYLERLSLHQIVGLFIQSLNLHHGDDYGRAWFSSIARTLLKLAISSTLPMLPKSLRSKVQPTRTRFPKIESFADLDEIITFLAKDGDDFQAARHLKLIVETLSEYEQLNFSPTQNPNHPAVRNAIHMPEVIREKQVIYFYLSGAIDASSVGEIGRLALYSLLAAAIAHKEMTNRTPRCYFIADEAQLLIAQNIANVLAQARSYGVSCTLAHQSMSQLNPPGAVDLRELVMSCTSVKQYFSARDPMTQKYLSDVSGEVAYYTHSWHQSAATTANGLASLGYAMASPSHDGISPPMVSIAEYLGPRLTPQDIQDVNHDPNQSIILIERGQGLSQFVGAFPMRTDWPITYSEFVHRRDELSWPTSTETIIISSAWPVGNAHTITPQTTPAEVSQRLNDIRRKLQGD